MGSIRAMFDPRTVALIGASEKEGAIGRTLLENLLKGGKRQVFPVNPVRESCIGEKCYASVRDVPVHLDLAVIATPAPTVPAVVEECGRAGVEGVVIISAGFREIGREGRQLEDRIDGIRKHYGMRIVGPNCIGFIRPSISLNATFIKAAPEAGKIAFISHSGALGSAILDWAIEAHIGFSMFVSLGSMLDVDFGDLIDFLGDDQATKSILIYMESVGHAKKFMSAARGFARSKPIIILKPGRYEEASRAALSHTGAMTGDDQVYDAAFKRAGAVRVPGIDDLFNASSVLDSRNVPKGPRVVIVTNAGGPGAITTDRLVGGGGKLASLTEESLKELDAFLPAYWSRSNPVDVLGDTDVERYVEAMKICMNDPNVDGLVLIYTPQGPLDPTELAKAVTERAKRASKPVITTFMGGKSVAEARQIFNVNDIPTYPTPEDAVKTYLYMHRYQRNLELLYETPADLPVDQAPPKNNLKALIRAICAGGRRVLTEDESKRFLRNYKIPTTKTRLAKNVEEALGMAKETGYPVVLKIASPDISHKSDIGGVVTGIDSADRLTEEYGGLLERAKSACPGATIRGVTVQKMIEGIDYELILGAKKDRDFGAVILFGMGGIGAEIFRDFSIGLPPLNQTLARRLMEETKVYELIRGFRGKRPADMTRLEQLIVSFANMIVDFPEIKEMDINPIAISQGAPVALDARIIIDDNCLEYLPPYPHLVISPYPTRYVTPWSLGDGTPVILRPIRPEDEPLEYEMLNTLSEESMRGRFFLAPRHVGHEELTRFCNIDYDREMAIIAELTEDGKRRMIGVSRLIIEADKGIAEFALLVHDDYQDRGLGYKLIDVLIGIAQEKRLGMVYGLVLTENRRMLSICEKTGFAIRHQPDRVSRVELILR